MGSSLYVASSGLESLILELLTISFEYQLLEAPFDTWESLKKFRPLLIHSEVDRDLDYAKSAPMRWFNPC